MRIVRRVSTKPVTVESSSDNDSTQPVPGPGPKTMAHRATTFPPSVAEGSATSLKRKRELVGTKLSPPGMQPVVMVARKVVSVPSANKAASTRLTRSSPSPAKRASPAKPSTAPSAMQAKVRMRKVVDNRKLNAVAPPETAAPSQGPGTEEASTMDPGLASAASSKAPPIIVEVMSSPVAPGHEQPSETVESPPSAAPTAIQTPFSIPAEQLGSQSHRQSQTAPPHEPEPEATGLRRTTRSRRSAQSATDVFGTVVSAARPRPKQKVFVDEGPFSQFSQVQLKTLTSKNTEWNQKQLCEMSTQVIMKVGKRPESPTTKVRNVLEQQREEKNQQRQDRAARRARKSTETDDEDLELDDEDMTNVEEDAGELPMTHRRGPGDEEDYHTPEKDRPLKRSRLGDDATENRDSRQEKRVKWDRGLFQTVYLTDLPPNPRRPPKEELTKKGCLSNAAKV